MKKVDAEKIKKLRSDHNKDILKRLEEGASLKSYDSESSWFPPRPLIEKDEQAMARLYNEEQGSQKKKKFVGASSEPGKEAIGKQDKDELEGKLCRLPLPTPKEEGTEASKARSEPKAAKPSKDR